MKDQTITSPSNAKYASLMELQSSKGIRSQNLCLLMGRRFAEEALVRHPDLVKEQILTTEMQELSLPKTSVTDQQQLEKTYLSKKLFQDLDLYGTHDPILVMQIPQMKPLQGLYGAKPRVILPLGNPINLGACIRSCVGFGVSSVILTQESCHPFHPQALRAAAGHCFDIDFSESKSTFSELVGQNHQEISTSQLFCLDLNGTPLETSELPENLILAVGQEGKGIPRTFQGQRLQIQTRQIDSLNAGVSLSLALYEYRRQHRLEDE